ncbi:Amidase [Penicillium sp. IBT 18751x]|nr:Amidase [Penicillium sp. IBT 18751x]
MNILDLTISIFHDALRQQTSSCAAIVHAYLDRIAQYDPTLKTLISINPQALAIAIEKDKETTHFLQNGISFPPLHGVPIILKDNYTTYDLPTSAGVAALRTLRSTDSAVVHHLRTAGAIILAKANLHEFALHGTTTSSLGGQARNPYDLTRTPGGSSGGTAAALAANLGLVGCGTDTMNSLRSPSSACAIVGFRPSKGNVSLKGIVPVSETQDMAGPMGRTVGDVRILYEVMRHGNGRTIREMCTMKAHGRIRVGVLETYFKLEENNPDLPEKLILENEMVQSIVRIALKSVEASGADIELVSIDSSCHDWSLATLLTTVDTQPFEFKDCLEQFLQSPEISSPHQTLQSILESGEYDKNAVTDVFYASLKDPATYSRTSAKYKTRLEKIARLKQSVQSCFDESSLDALVYPHQRQLAIEIGPTIQPRRNGVLAALTGNPAVCLPAGFSPPTASAPLGVPIGLELMGRHGCDEELLFLAERVEGILRVRRQPDLSMIDRQVAIGR